MKKNRILKNLKWYVRAPNGANQFNGSTLDWNKTLLRTLFKADVEILKNIANMSNSDLIINPKNKRYLYISKKLIDLIFSFELYPIIRDFFKIVIQIQSENEDFLIVSDEHSNVVEIEIINDLSPKINSN